MKADIYITSPLRGVRLKADTTSHRLFVGSAVMRTVHSCY
jgi:hypothetical protein